ncbi:MAG: hypothetical protein AB7O21_14035 [Gammaproteobacteria bacterium]
MKFPHLSAAIAALLASTAAPAFDPSVSAPDFEVVIAGASAPGTALRSLLIRDLCDAGPAIDVFVHGGTARHFNVACVIGGRPVLLRKNEGGSSAGVRGVDTKSTQPFLNAGAASCNAPVARSVGGRAFNEYSGCGATAATLTNLVPDFGLSDVEPTALTGPLAPTGQSFQNVSGLTIQNIASLLFGFVVTTDLYRALQAAQFAPANACNPDPATGTDVTRPDPANPVARIAGANGIKDAYEAPATDSGIAQTPTSVSARHTLGDTERCMPILSRDELRSLLARDITSGNNLWVGPNAGDTLTARSAGKDYGSASGAINLCRRNAGSGTHAVTAMHFLSTNCGKGEFLVPNAVCSGATVCPVNSNDSASGMEACLGGHNTANAWAVGYQSVEKNADLAQPYRFVKIDGASPTLNNLLSGNYGHFGELTAVRRGNTSDLVNVPNPADHATANGIWSTIVTRLTTAANVGTLDALDFTKQPFGPSGFAARGSPPFPPDPTAPVNPLTHTRPGTSVQNTCTGPFASPVGAGTGRGVAH